MIVTAHGARVVVNEAQEWEEFSAELVEHADPALLRVDGDLITITADNGTWRYQTVDQTPHGWLARLVTT